METARLDECCDISRRLGAFNQFTVMGKDDESAEDYSREGNNFSCPACGNLVQQVCEVVNDPDKPEPDAREIWLTTHIGDAI